MVPRILVATRPSCTVHRSATILHGARDYNFFLPSPAKLKCRARNEFRWTGAVANFDRLLPLLDELPAGPPGVDHQAHVRSKISTTEERPSTDLERMVVSHEVPFSALSSGAVTRLFTSAVDRPGA